MQTPTHTTPLSPQSSPLSPPNSPLGLIAGQGQLPIQTAQGMRNAGHQVICAALSGQARVDELRPLCHHLKIVGLLRLNQWIRTLKRHGCSQAVMVGRVGATELYQRFHLFRYLPDWRAARIWFLRARHDKRNDRLLAAVADELQSGGITLIDGRPFVPDSLATPGLMNTAQPTPQIAADIDFAWPLLRKLNELLIGQALTCLDRGILAVEAVEGTDRLIQRTGEVCKRKGWILCKASNPNQDIRFDVPTIGLKTLEELHHHGGRAIILEAARTIMLEKEKLLARADQLGIPIIGIT